MLKNYFKTALRNIVRHKMHSIITTFGLSIGLASCILILLYISDELSYDGFHMNGDRIYRVVEKFTSPDRVRYHSGTPAPLASAIWEEFPEVINTARIGYTGGEIVVYGTKELRGNKGSFADPSIFQLFSLQFLEGNPESALNDNKSIVITKNLAQKLFADEDPINKIIYVGEEGSGADYSVTGIMQNPTSNSDFNVDYYISFQTLNQPGNEGNLSWRAWNHTTFVLLRQNQSPEALEAKFPAFIEKYVGKDASHNVELFLQPLRQIHINLDPLNELPTDVNSNHIYIFAGIALLILLLACFNFINLTTVHYMTREKEVGIRKVLGAQKPQIARQFLGESILFTLISFFLSIPLIEFFLPMFNQYAGKELSFISASDFVFLLCIFCLAILIGIAAGSYPAFFISKYQPVRIFAKQYLSRKPGSSSLLRGMLVLIQFSITIGFIACAFIMRDQLGYIQSKNLGYDKDHLVVIPIYHKDVKPKYELYKAEILRNTGILSATATSYIPSQRCSYQNVWFKGSDEAALRMIGWIAADYDFINTMDIQLAMGKDFSPDVTSDIHTAYIVNKTAVKSLGWEQPIGEQMKINDWGPVIGVVNDFHFNSLHQEISPLAICIYPEIFKYLIIRIQPQNIIDSMNSLMTVWRQVFQGQPFEYFFLDEDFDRLYKSEIRQTNVFTLISLLAIGIACLGLFGLAAFCAGRRTKEIGIRKVMGASVLVLFLMLSKESLKWVVLANVTAWPIVWYVMTQWLENYAYRIDLHINTFLLSGCVALSTSLFAIGYQVLKAARANPVEALRYE